MAKEFVDLGPYKCWMCGAKDVKLLTCGVGGLPRTQCTDFAACDLRQAEAAMPEPMTWQWHKVWTEEIQSIYLTHLINTPERIAWRSSLTMDQSCSGLEVLGEFLATIRYINRR